MSSESERIRVGDHVTIYPRGRKKIWCADFWRNGCHCRQSLSTPNKKIASQRAMQLEVQLESGIYQTPPPEITVSTAAANYLAYLKTEDRSPRTLIKYKGILDTFAAFLADRRVQRLHQFSAVHFDQFRSMRRSSRHAKTIYTEGVVVKQFMRWSLSRKLIRENPIADFKMSKPPLVPKEGPGLKDVDGMLAKAEAPLKTMLAALAFTGMRSGELERLRKDDVDLVGNWLHIVSRIGAETKSRSSRKVPIHERLRALLQEHPRRPGPWFFTADASRKYPTGGHHISTKKLNDKFLKLLKTLGLPTGRNHGFTIHSLRHFFETLTVNSGIPQRVVDTWLGHQSDKSMAAIYYRLKDEDSQTFMTRVPF